MQALRAGIVFYALLSVAAAETTAADPAEAPLTNTHEEETSTAVEEPSYLSTLLGWIGWESTNTDDEDSIDDARADDPADDESEILDQVLEKNVSKIRERKNRVILWICCALAGVLILSVIALTINKRRYAIKLTNMIPKDPQIIDVRVVTTPYGRHALTP